MVSNRVDPVTQEPLADLPYPAFVIEQNGQEFGFDPLALRQYILREGKAVNVFNRQPFTPDQLGQLQDALDQLHANGHLTEKTNIVGFVRDKGRAVESENADNADLEFLLENTCSEVVGAMVICCKFYDEDVANKYMLNNILPRYQDALRQLLTHSRESAMVTVKRTYQSLMQPFRDDHARMPTRPLATAIAYVKKLESNLFCPVFVIEKQAGNNT